MKPVDQWPLWARALFWNACIAAGEFLGFALSRTNLSSDLLARIGVFTLAFMNVMLLSVRPRILAGRTNGNLVKPWSALYRVIADRPLAITVFVLQLLGVGRATAATISLARTSMSAYVAAQPNAQHLIHRLVGASVVMAAVAILWTVGAVGLWQNRRWAWWLALVLNGLAAATCAILQVLKPDQFLLDIPSTIAVVLLLFPSVRNGFRVNQAAAMETTG